MITLNHAAELMQTVQTAKKSYHAALFADEVIFVPRGISSSNFHSESSRNRRLYVCECPEICIQLLENSPDDLFVCPAPQFKDHKTNPEDKIIFMPKDTNAFEFYLELQEKSTSIARWDKLMEAALVSGGSYQDLIDIAEEMIDCCILVLNSEFRLLAYSSKSNPRDHMAHELIQRGFHSPEVVKRLKESGATTKWKKQTGMTISNIDPDDEFAGCSYVLRHQGNYAGHILIRKNEDPISLGMLDLLSLMIGHIESCVAIDKRIKHENEQEPSSLFGELINNHPYSAATFIQRLQRLPIEQFAPYQLFLFRFEGQDAEFSLSAYCINLLKKAFPLCYVGLYESAVLMLDPTGLIGEEQRPVLQSFLNAHPATVGISDHFDDLREFSFAYRQADAAVMFSSEAYATLETEYIKEKQHSIFEFKDIYVRYVAETARNTSVMLDYCVSHGLLERIRRYDREHGTDDAYLLYVYLTNDRRISDSCRLLFLHRSTFLYRLEKLKERFGIDLDDFKVRQNLLFEYLIYPVDD